MEPPVPGCGSPRLVVGQGEAQGQQHRDDRLDREADRGHPDHHPTDVGEVDGPSLRCGHDTGAQAEPAGDGDADERGASHDAETTDLDEQQDHDLAEMRPVRAGVDDGEPDDAGGRGGREERVDEVGVAWPAARHRRPEQQRADADDGEEAERDQLARRSPRSPSQALLEASHDHARSGVGRRTS